MWLIILIIVIFVIYRISKSNGASVSLTPDTYQQYYTECRQKIYLYVQNNIQKALAKKDPENGLALLHLTDAMTARKIGELGSKMYSFADQHPELRMDVNDFIVNYGLPEKDLIDEARKQLENR